MESKSQLAIGETISCAITIGKALAIAAEGGDAVPATKDNAASGDYPLSRYLYVYVNKKPDQPISPIEREFIKLVLSRQGQEVVAKDGYVPVSAEVAARELAKIQ